MTLGRAATPEPFDLGAVAGSDELFEAFATRRLTDLGAGHAGSDDPAAALLAALVADVDLGAPPLSAHARSGRGRTVARRRGVRAVVTLGVAALVMASAGAAAAGGGNGPEALRPPHRPVHLKETERSNANAQKQVPSPGTGLTARHTPASGRDGDRRTGRQAEPDDTLGDRSGRRGHRTSRAHSRIPVDIGHSSPKTPRSAPPAETSPTPVEEDLSLVR